MVNNTKAKLAPPVNEHHRQGPSGAAVTSVSKPAFLFDLGGQGDHRRHVQIRRPAQQLVLPFGADQDVGQDGESALAVGDTVSKVEPTQELVLLDLELHPFLPSFPLLFYIYIGRLKSSCSKACGDVNKSRFPVGEPGAGACG